MSLPYGIPNRDTPGKAHRRLDGPGSGYRDFDRHRDGPGWKHHHGRARRPGRQSLLNRRGAAGRGLSAPLRGLCERSDAPETMPALPTLTRRPAPTGGSHLHAGFSHANRVALCREEGGA